MFGNFKIKINSKDLIYDLTVYRKIIRITEESAVGKSVLCDLIRDYETNKYSIVNVSCKYRCRLCIPEEFTYIGNLYVKLSNKYKKHNSMEYYNAVRELFAEWENTVFLLMKTT